MSNNFNFHEWMQTKVVNGSEKVSTYIRNLDDEDFEIVVKHFGIGKIKREHKQHSTDLNYPYGNISAIAFMNLADQLNNKIAEIATANPDSFMWISSQIGTEIKIDTLLIRDLTREDLEKLVHERVSRNKAKALVKQEVKRQKRLEHNMQKTTVIDGVEYLLIKKV